MIELIEVFERRPAQDRKGVGGIIHRIDACEIWRGHLALLSAPVAPGEFAGCRAQADRLFRPAGLFVQTACQPHFEIVSVLVGSRPQFRERWNTSASDWLDWFDTLQIDQFFSVTVRNTSDAVQVFAADVPGKALVEVTGQ